MCGNSITTRVCMKSTNMPGRDGTGDGMNAMRMRDNFTWQQGHHASPPICVSLRHAAGARFAHPADHNLRWSGDGANQSRGKPRHVWLKRTGSEVPA